MPLPIGSGVAAQVGRNAMHQIAAVAAMFVLIALGAKRMASKNESDHRDLAVIIALLILITY
jgi:hypothetical protein